MIGIESIAALLKWRVLEDSIFLDLNSSTCINKAIIVVAVRVCAC
jgi:hypothetical protein